MLIELHAFPWFAGSRTNIAYKSTETSFMQRGHAEVQALCYHYYYKSKILALG